MLQNAKEVGLQGASAVGDEGNGRLAGAEARAQTGDGGIETVASVDCGQGVESAGKVIGLHFRDEGPGDEGGRTRLGRRGAVACENGREPVPPPPASPLQQYASQQHGQQRGNNDPAQKGKGHRAAPPRASRRNLELIDGDLFFSSVSPCPSAKGCGVRSRIGN